MDLTLAKSEGYLKNQLQHSQSLSGKKLLAVIGVYTGFGSRLNRNVYRGSWMPRGQFQGVNFNLYDCSLVKFDHYNMSEG